MNAAENTINHTAVAKALCGMSLTDDEKKAVEERRNILNRGLLRQHQMYISQRTHKN